MEQADFLVVGGGIAGVSAAAHLAELGRVVLVERETALGYHASGRSAAIFVESYGNRSTVALNQASKDYLMLENGGVLSPRGLMLVGDTGRAEDFETDLATLGMSALSPDDSLDLVPILNLATVARVGYREDCLDIDTDRLIQNFAREVRTRGGKVIKGASVQGLADNGREWDVIVGDHAIRARILVNAAGAWADDIARLAGIAPLGLSAYRRSMARIPAPAGHDVSRWPMMLGAGERWYAKPDAGHLIVSPADEEPAAPQDAWADDLVLAEGLARYEHAVTAPVTRLETSWAGLRTFSPDRSLVIGAEPGNPRFFWCAGQGGYGFQTAPAAGRLLAGVVSGQRSDLDRETLNALDPQRFR